MGQDGKKNCRVAGINSRSRYVEAAKALRNGAGGSMIHSEKRVKLANKTY